MSCDTFEKGFKKLSPSENNEKQEAGKNSLVFFLITLIFFFLSVGFSLFKKFKLAFVFLILSLAMTGIMITTLKSDPQKILSIGDYIISSGVDSGYFLNLDEYFPLYKKLEEKSSIFRGELDKLLANSNDGKDISFTKDTFGGKNKEIGGDTDIVENRGWRIFNIKLGDKIFDSARIFFPELTKAVEDVKEIRSVNVSILDHKTKIPIHIGYYKGIIRYMLPLKVPKKKEECFLCVNGEKYVWEEGKSVLWDDTYPHKVYNKTDEQRVVLYMDIERQGLGYFREKFNSFFGNLITGSSIVKEEIKRTEIKQDL